ncbi:MAG: Holliday junction branch migration protein RuvA [Treponema sp.]|jgi:Holliday junction DNA helicase RuvA|nr:Holliday junction branch migration protein RuvA [Treponema sp.]
MFNSLTGTITGKYPNTVYIDTYGIEWDIYVPDSALEKLPPVGQVGKVYTWLNHTDKLMQLYGFATKEERALFFDLLKVDGIGAKGAIRILSNISGPQLLDALDSGNIAELERIPGLGKKTAAKMMLALKGKLTLEEATADHSGTAGSLNPFGDVIASLANMGYDKKDCGLTIDRLYRELSADSSFNEKSKADKEDLLFRRALVELVQ